jgi:hypothetical protein
MPVQDIAPILTGAFREVREHVEFAFGKRDGCEKDPLDRRISREFGCGGQPAHSLGAVGARKRSVDGGANARRHPHCPDCPLRCCSTAPCRLD